jgi:hypothetical protein
MIGEMVILLHRESWWTSQSRCIGAFRIAVHSALGAGADEHDCGPSLQGELLFFDPPTATNSAKELSSIFS